MSLPQFSTSFMNLRWFLSVTTTAVTSANKSLQPTVTAPTGGETSNVYCLFWAFTLQLIAASVRLDFIVNSMAVICSNINNVSVCETMRRGVSVWCFSVGETGVFLEVCGWVTQCTQTHLFSQAGYIVCALFVQIIIKSIKIEEETSYFCLYCKKTNKQTIPPMTKWTKQKRRNMTQTCWL